VDHLIVGWGLESFNRRGKFFARVRGGIRQCNVTYGKNVALRCGCSVPAVATGLVCSGHCTASSTRSRRVHSLHEGQRCSSSQITLGFLVTTFITCITVITCLHLLCTITTS